VPEPEQAHPDALFLGLDAPVIDIVRVLLRLVAFGAGYIQTVRASRGDSMEALRYE